jgi:hypothetical protein
MFGDRNLDKSDSISDLLVSGEFRVRSALTLWNGDNDYAANLSSSNRAASELLGILPRYLSCIIILAMGQSIAAKLFISMVAIAILNR